MLIDKSYKPELCASPDFTRTTICNPYLNLEDPGAPKVLATDGYVLVVLPCTVEEGDTQGPISKEALLKARKMAGRNMDEASLSCNGQHKLLDGSTIPRPEACEFPPYKAVIPCHKEGDEGTFTVCLDPRRLIALAKAMGAEDMIRLTFKVSDDGVDPIRVQPGYANDREGALMPGRKT